MFGKKRKDEIKQNTEFLRHKLLPEFDRVPLPDSLRAKNLINTLEQISQEKIELSTDKKTQSSRPMVFRQVLAYAAAFAVVIGAYWGFERWNESAIDRSAVPREKAGAYSAPNTNEVYAQDYEQLRDIISNLHCSLDDNDMNGTFGIVSDKWNPGFAGETQAAMPEVGKNELASDSAEDFGGTSGTGTNVQVTGVDEADILKTDGEYLYYMTGLDNASQVQIIDPVSLETVSQIEGDPNYQFGELFVAEQHLTVIYTDQVFATPIEASAADLVYHWPSGSVKVEVYDLQKIEKPTLVRSFEQDGSYVSSRMMNNTVYLVTSKYVYDDLTSTNVQPEDYLPVVCDAVGDKAAQPQTVHANDIAILPQPSVPCYTTVSAIDMINTSEPVQTKSVLGSNGQLYMSQQNLYVMGEGYDNNTGENFTEVMKFAVEETQIDFTASAQIAGRIDNQFSADEYEGNFRIATTAFTNGSTDNRITILDEEFHTIGELSGLAPGEQIYSVRFMGDMGYVVTFKNVDPLFAVDLSDPANPTVLGQLKIPGFSEYMHPIDQNTLIGVGRNTVALADGGVAQLGLKLSMFDVSDPQNPRESHKFLIGTSMSDSQVLYDHKVFWYDSQKSLFGLPVQVYTETVLGKDSYGISTEYSLDFMGMFVFKADSKTGFTLVGKITHCPDEPDDFNRRINRGISIGETLYTVSDHMIQAHSLKDFSLQGSRTL